MDGLGANMTHDIRKMGLFLASSLAVVNVLQIVVALIHGEPNVSNSFQQARSVWSLVGLLGVALVFLPVFVSEALRARGLRASIAWWLLAIALVSDGVFGYYKPSVPIDWRIAIDAIFAFVYLASLVLLRERTSHQEPLM